MNIKVQKKLKSKKGIFIVPVFEDKLEKINQSYPKKVNEYIKKRVKAKELKAKRGEMSFSYIDSRDLPEKLLVLGLGKSENYNAKNARRVGGIIGKYIKSKKIEEINLLLLAEMTETAGELMEGLMFSQYRLGIYKTAKDKKKKPFEIKTVNLLAEKSDKKLGESLDRATRVAEATDFVKDLVNGPSNLIDEKHMVREARRIAKENKYKIAVFGEKELKKMKWGGVLAVNQGSDKEPGCIVLEYNGGKSNEKPIVLVGKGVIFDAGGYNIKPTSYIELMHQDMAGAATVLGVFSVLKKLGIKRNVIGITPIVENLISGKAYKPSDIIRMYSGQTVEVTNTDAEGRLILADGIAYATELNPAEIITIATLTGAVSVALGPRYAGLIGNDRKLRSELQMAGKKTDDLGWPLPLPKDYKKKMDSSIADIRNHDDGTAREAGSSKGAAFLERFVKGNKWCHIDIGGTAFTKDPKDYEGKGATAHGLRMLIKYLESC